MDTITGPDCLVMGADSASALGALVCILPTETVVDLDLETGASDCAFPSTFFFPAILVLPPNLVMIFLMAAAAGIFSKAFAALTGADDCFAAVSFFSPSCSPAMFFFSFVFAEVTGFFAVVSVSFFAMILSAF
ncbi:MAG: hypothetical protein NTX50_28280 [Candidatus Sumerlaeota bacterium]|nr:hypothetical protein [Candidatus Sumerlaeota bacterium]